MALTAERLREVLEYDPNTGIFIWRKNYQRRFIGRIAGGLHSSGYICVYVDCVPYKAHRLAWLYTEGVWPVGQIDHINGVRNDNRRCNLRTVSQAENSQNQKRAHKNKKSSPYLGVYYYKQHKKWTAIIEANGVRKYLGLFISETLALLAYQKAKHDLHISGEA